MAVLSFDAYSGRDLQNFIALIDQCESSGLHDAGSIRAHIMRYLSAQLVMKERNMHDDNRPCMSCGKGVLVGPYHIDGILVIRCSVKCGYSEVIW